MAGGCVVFCSDCGQLIRPRGRDTNEADMSDRQRDKPTCLSACRPVCACHVHIHMDRRARETSNEVDNLAMAVLFIVCLCLTPNRGPNSMICVHLLLRPSATFVWQGEDTIFETVVALAFTADIGYMYRRTWRSYTSKTESIPRTHHRAVSPAQSHAVINLGICTTHTQRPRYSWSIRPSIHL